MRVWSLVALLAGLALAGCIANEEAPPAPAADLPDGPMPATAGTFASGTRSFEPTLGVTSDGSVFLSTFASVRPGVRSAVVRTSDGGQTWTDVTPQVGPVSMPPNSNDPYVHVDQDTDRVFLFDMQALTCHILSFSDDGGESWTSNPASCGQPVGGQDHQTFFTSRPRTLTPVGYENIAHYCVNRVADAACSFSLDSGMTWSPLRPLVYSGVSGGVCGGLHGHGVADPDGRIYLGKGHCGRPTVAVSADDGLTWAEHVISSTHGADTHDVNLAFDDGGTGYAFWRSGGRPVLAVSTDHGATWSEPVDVWPDAGISEFHAVAAGGPGNAAMVFYGTTDALSAEDLEDRTPWDLYLVTVRDATGTPVIEVVQANPVDDPVARGPCDDGNRCGGVGDFIDIVIGADGRPWAAFVDVCSGACAAPDGTQREGTMGSVATLLSGPRLRGDGDLPVLVRQRADDAP